VRRKNNAAENKEIARQRIVMLFELASNEMDLHPERSDRYVEIARNISTRIRIRMPPHIKKMYCKYCGCYLNATRCRVRLRDGIITTTCQKCGKQKRLPYKKEKKSCGP
jgi:ribonuclease P protein subunit RPR2